MNDLAKTLHNLERNLRLSIDDRDAIHTIADLLHEAAVEAERYVTPPLATARLTAHTSSIRHPEVVTERQVRDALSEIYHPEGAVLWYDSPNPHLNAATPRQFVDAGDGWRVLQIIDALATGAHT